jgi:Ca2+-binding EF-hand superfamily protein
MNNKLPFIIALILWVIQICHAEPSKKSANTVIYGPVESITADGKTLTITYKGKTKEQIILTENSKFFYNGILEEKNRKIQVGYSIRANVNKDKTIKQIHVSEALNPVKPLGPNRTKMTPTEVFAAADANQDGKLSYIEISASIYRSEKHGPQHFPVADSNSDGTLDADEFAKYIENVSWWKWSRKSAEEWFKQGDKNTDGKIDISEFSFFYKGHIDVRFPAADKNKNDSLDLSETKAVLKKLISGLE